MSLEHQHQNDFHEPISPILILVIKTSSPSFLTQVYFQLYTYDCPKGLYFNPLRRKCEYHKDVPVCVKESPTKNVIKATLVNTKFFIFPFSLKSYHKYFGVHLKVFFKYIKARCFFSKLHG